MAYENLTTFTESDPSNHWSETTTRATYASLVGNENSYVYKDYGVDYFGSTFIHYVDAILTSDSVGIEGGYLAGIWGITRTPGDYNTIFTHYTSPYDAVLLYFGAYDSSGEGDIVFYLGLEANMFDSDYSFGVLEKNVMYYFSIERAVSDESNDKITVTVYGSDADRTANTNVLATLVVHFWNTIFHRYLQCGFSSGQGDTSTANGYNENFDLDAYVSPTVTKTINSDVHFKGTESKTVLSDVYFKSENQQTIPSDVYFSIAQKTINSDVHFKGTESKTINSDVKFVIEGLYDIINKINTVKQVLPIINNTISFAKRILNDVTCTISTAKGKIYDIGNKVNTQARKLYDVNNDIRFIKSWQKAGNFGFQSLGKAYIKVFIATVEQTDVDVDSINIHKQLNSAHTASFDLARTYDNVTVPVLESVIEIRYYQSGMVNYWLLFKGYVTSVVPSDSPESITVNCQDEYWKTNQTNKYFFVGHNPYDNREKYYDTIKQALLTESGWSLSIGDFVPEIIDCFGQGQSDIVSSLIEQTGNFGWWYDVDGTRKLWEGGRGSQVNIQRQEIGKNIDIYQLIEHKITTTSENVINRYRVQMGQKTGRSSQGSRQYEVYTSSNFEGQAIPAWNRSLEKLAKKGTSNGYGFNYTGIDNADDYKDVFRKFSIPSLDSDTESWSDRYPPKIEVFNPGGWGGSVYGFPLAGGVITEGFTIDYENRFITFNEPIFLTYTNNYGEVTAIRAPILRVSLWKEIYHTYTATSSEDAGNTVSNPYMFFREATGFVPTPTYPVTITKLLNLTGLTHQEGFTYNDYWGVSHTIRTFDDTDYAKDYIDWQLSNTCDAKINGTFTLTLDSLCFNSIDLSKRIYIEGITDTPLNIISISYNLTNFTISIEVENKRYYQRTVSIPRHD